MRYKLIADWLERDSVSVDNLINCTLTTKEIIFITKFKKARINKHRPELSKYFNGRIIDEYKYIKK